MEPPPRQRSTAETGPLDWSLAAMRESTSRLLRARGWDRAHGFAAISEAVWWVTMVDATLVRYHPDIHGAVLAHQDAAERRMTEGTFAGLRFVRNRMGHDADLADFIQPLHPAPGAAVPGIAVVITMENTGFASLIGNPNAPWINQAAQTYGLATSYFGVTHPSQPNYIAATSGSTNGVTTDNDVTINVPNIVDQLEAHGKTWKAYMQSFALCATPLDHACGNQLYERKHNPFVSYTDVQSNPARLANIVDLSQFAADLAGNTVPDYAWISPDQCHDMHGRAATPSDPCDFSQEQSLIAAGDAFLRSTVSAIMSSRAWTGNSVIFITWDESDFTGSGFQGFGDDSGCCDSPPGQGGGHVVTLTISHSNHSPATSDVAFNHYSMLATIEDGWHLGCLAFTCDTANVQPMSDLVGPRG